MTTMMATASLMVMRMMTAMVWRTMKTLMMTATAFLMRMTSCKMIEHQKQGGVDNGHSGTASEWLNGLHCNAMVCKMLICHSTV